MKLVDEIVVANINNKNKILIIDKNSESDIGFYINAYDLEGEKYLLEYDLACFNGFSGKGRFDYYLNGKLLKSLTEYKQATIKDSEVDLKKLKQIEEKLNVKENEKVM